MRETLLAFISSRPFFFITLSDAARTLCFWKHCRALPISVRPTPHPPPHPMASQPEWGQTAESQQSHCGLSPSPATLEIAKRKCWALCQWCDGVTSVATGWVNTHDPRLTFLFRQVCKQQTRKNTRKSPTVQKIIWLVWMGDSPDLIMNIKVGSIHTGIMLTCVHRTSQKLFAGFKPIYTLFACLE